MGRKSESEKDDAAKAVISSSSPRRLRQAPAHSSDASFARPRGAGAGGATGVPSSPPTSIEKKEKGKGTLSQAPGTFVEEETKEEIEPIMADEKEKVCSYTTVRKNLPLTKEVSFSQLLIYLSNISLAPNRNSWARPLGMECSLRSTGNRPPLRRSRKSPPPLFRRSPRVCNLALLQ